MSAVVVLGSMNVDHLITLNTQPAPGQTLLAESLTRFPGGKGANQAVAAARVGANVRMHAIVGNDSGGEYLVESLRREGVDITQVLTRGDQTGVAIILVSMDAENSIVVIPGANHKFAASDVGQLENVVTKGDIVVAQLEIPVEVVAAGFQTARRAGALTVLNAAPYAEVTDLLSQVDVLIVNQTEAHALLGTHVSTLNEAVEAAKVIAHRYDLTAVVTAGELGAAFSDRTSSLAVTACSVIPVDTTGAGDTFVGALAAMLAEQKTFEHAIRVAVEASGLACLSHGAQSSMPYRRNLTTLTHLA